MGVVSGPGDVLGIGPKSAVVTIGSEVKCEVREGSELKLGWSRK